MEGSLTQGRARTQLLPVLVFGLVQYRVEFPMRDVFVSKLVVLSILTP